MDKIKLAVTEENVELGDLPPIHVTPETKAKPGEGDFPGGTINQKPAVPADVFTVRQQLTLDDNGFAKINLRSHWQDLVPIKREDYLFYDIKNFSIKAKPIEKMQDRGGVFYVGRVLDPRFEFDAEDDPLRMTDVKIYSALSSWTHTAPVDRRQVYTKKLSSDQFDSTPGMIYLYYKEPSLRTYKETETVQRDGPLRPHLVVEYEVCLYEMTKDLGINDMLTHMTIASKSFATSIKMIGENCYFVAPIEQAPEQFVTNSRTTVTFGDDDELLVAATPTDAGTEAGKPAFSFNFKPSTGYVIRGTLQPVLYMLVPRAWYLDEYYYDYSVSTGGATMSYYLPVTTI